MGQSQSTDLFCDTEVSGDTDVLQTRGVGMKKGWNKAFKRILAQADRELKEFERTCPYCQGNNLEIIAGKELFVESIEVE